MKKILLLLMLVVSINSKAQSKKTKPIFTSINSIGTVWGSSQNVFVFETINGISFKKWSVGLGIAFDAYGSQSTPLFLDFRKNFGARNNFFIYTDAGLNLPWQTTYFPKKYIGTNTPAYILKNTFYGEFGLGLKTPINTQTSFVASIGYSYKTFSYIQQNMYDWSAPTNTSNNYNFDFYYKRLALRFGIQF